MTNRKIITISLLFFLTTISCLSIFSVGVSAQVPKISGTTPLQTVVIDGVINEAEWANRDWKINFTLDIDDVFNPPDKDGINYMYLGEDHTNFYVGLDLVSDQTGDPTGEWLGIWMNVNNRSFDSMETWVSYLDNGTESVLHDVEYDRPLPFFTNQTFGLGYGYKVNNDGEINAIYGTTQGNYTDLDNTGTSFNITSASVVAENLTQVDFSVDIKEWNPLFPEIYAASVTEMRLRIKCRSNITIDNHKVVFWYNNGTMNENDAQQTISINNGTISFLESLYYGVGNLSSDYIMKFSIIGDNSAPFETYLESIDFGAAYNQTNTFGGAMLNPYSSISNYDIKWSFGTSANNMTAAHRMFEVRIPKSELENYNASEEIGIIVGGYGTMSFPDEVFWVYGKKNTSIRFEDTANYMYYNMLGINPPPAPQSPAVPGFYLPIVIALATVSTYSLIRRQKNKLK